MQSFIRTEISKTADLLNVILKDQLLLQTLEALSEDCIQLLKQGRKLLLAGNGGSAADAQHLAAELVNRLRLDRPGIAAVALTTDSSIITSIANDYGFEYLFARQIEALGKPNDIFLGISTSGKSKNILAALQCAKKMGLRTVGLTGQHVEAIKPLCDYLIAVPSSDTQKIQEAHIILGHIICGIIDDAFSLTAKNPQKIAITN